MAPFKTQNLNKEILEQDYKKLKSIRKVAIKYNLHHKSMSNLFTKLGIIFNPKITRTKNENIFSEKTEKAFYLAGFIAADGNIHHSKNNYHLHIRLGLSDEIHLLLLQKLLNSNSKIREVKNHKSIIADQIIISTTKGFTVCSKQIYEDLMKNFCIIPNKSLTLKFPKHLSKHPLIHHFIRGYFDGDGSWTIRNPNSKNKQSKINIGFDIIGTKHFVKNVNYILHSQLKLPSNKIEKKGNIYRLRYSGNRLSSLIGDWLYRDATIYLDRKYQRYLSAKILLNDSSII